MLVPDRCIPIRITGCCPDTATLLAPIGPRAARHPFIGGYCCRCSGNISARASSPAGPSQKRTRIPIAVETLTLAPEEQGAFAQAYHNTTNFEWSAVFLFALCAIALLVVHGRAAMFPFLIVISMISHAERVVIGGLDFGFMRLLLVVGAMRVLMRSETRGLRLHLFDVVVITSIVYGFAIEAVREGAYVRSLGN